MEPTVKSSMELLKLSSEQNELKVEIEYEGRVFSLNMSGLSFHKAEYIRQMIDFASKKHLTTSQVMTALPLVLKHLNIGRLKESEVADFLSFLSKCKQAEKNTLAIVHANKMGVLKKSQIMELSLNLDLRVLNFFYQFRSATLAEINHKKMIIQNYYEKLASSSDGVMFFHHRREIKDHILNTIDFVPDDIFMKYLDFSDPDQIFKEIDHLCGSINQIFEEKLKDFYTEKHFASETGGNLSRDYILVMSSLMGPSFLKSQLNHMLQNLLQKFHCDGKFFGKEIINNEYTIYNYSDYNIYNMLEYSTDDQKIYFFEPDFSHSFADDELYENLNTKSILDKSFVNTILVQNFFKNAELRYKFLSKDLEACKVFFPEEIARGACDSVGCFWELMASRNDAYSVFLNINELIKKEVIEYVNHINLQELDDLISEEPNYETMDELYDTFMDFEDSMPLTFSYGPEEIFSTYPDKLFRSYISIKIQILGNFLIQQKFEFIKNKFESILKGMIACASDDYLFKEELESLYDRVQQIEVEFGYEEALSKLFPKMGISYNGEAFLDLNF
jgi:hypothetical protein